MHWRNSDFQKVFFILQACHTADEMYRKALELWEDRDMAIKAAEKKEVPEEFDTACYIEAVRERDYIAALIDKIQPHRKYSHLPDNVAHQMAQAEYWREEFKFRIENYLLTGGIPADQMAAMRMHPEFIQILLPHLQKCQSQIRSSGDNPPEFLLGNPTFAAEFLLDHKAGASE